MQGWDRKTEGGENRIVTECFRVCTGEWENPQFVHCYFRLWDVAYISLSLYRFYIPPLWMSETDPALAVLRLALGWERRGRLCRVYIFNRFFMSARHSEWRLLTLRGKQASISCAVKIMAVPNTYWLTMLWLLVCVWLWVGVGGVRGLCVCVFVCVCMLVCEMHARLKFVCVYTSTHACNFVWMYMFIFMWW